MIQNVLNHRSLALTSIYARLNTKATDRALQAQADRFCRSIPSAGFIEQRTHRASMESRRSYRCRVVRLKER